MKRPEAHTLIFSLYLVIIALFTFSCGGQVLKAGSPSPHTRGNPLAIDSEENPLFLEDFEGSPFLLFVRSSWCPPCRETEEILTRELSSFTGKNNITLLIIDTKDRRILEEQGERSESLPKMPLPSSASSGGEEDNPRHLYSAGGKELFTRLKLRRIPALIGFYRNLVVADILYGSQSEMAGRIQKLIKKIQGPPPQES